jgi:hypothetical protein
MDKVISVGRYKGNQLVSQTRRYPGFIAGHEWSIRQSFKPFRVGDETIAWIQQPNIVNRIK